jgi:hypothetical protein
MTWKGAVGQRKTTAPAFQPVRSQVSWRGETTGERACR